MIIYCVQLHRAVRLYVITTMQKVSTQIWSRVLISSNTIRIVTYRRLWISLKYRFAFGNPFLPRSLVRQFSEIQTRLNVMRKRSTHIVTKRKKTFTDATKLPELLGKCYYISQNIIIIISSMLKYLLHLIIVSLKVLLITYSRE